jgi:hypothetical protein
LVLLQVNCRSIYNKTSNFRNLIGTYYPDVVIGTEPWRSEKISNAEVLGLIYTTFRGEWHTRGSVIFVKHYITYAELWVDKAYEILAVDVKGRDPKIAWEIGVIYRAPNEDMQVIEKLADRTGLMERTTKPSIIGGDLNLPYAEWNGHAKKFRGTQVFLNFRQSYHS